MAKYVKQLQAKSIALVPVNRVESVCNAAREVGMIVCGGALQKASRGRLYQWLYTEAA